MRTEFCVKDGIRITYTAENVSFEDVVTAESILIDNSGEVIFNNYSDDEVKTQWYIDYYKQIYPSIVLLRAFDSVEVAG